MTASPPPVELKIPDEPESWMMVSHLIDGEKIKPAHCLVVAKVEYDAMRSVATAAVAQLGERDKEIEEDGAVIQKFSFLLAEIAITVKGEELPLHRHSYHDLPKEVQVLKLAYEMSEAMRTAAESSVTELEERVRTLQLFQDLRQAGRQAELDQAVTPAYRSWLLSDEQKYRDCRGGNEVWNAATKAADQRASAAESEVEKLRGEVGEFANWIRQNPSAIKDHACARCVPHSDMLIEGFVCAQHRAIAALSQGGKA